MKTRPLETSGSPALGLMLDRLAESMDTLRPPDFRLLIVDMPAPPDWTQVQTLVNCSTRDLCQ